MNGCLLIQQRSNILALKEYKKAVNTPFIEEQLLCSNSMKQDEEINNVLVTTQKDAIKIGAFFFQNKKQ